jgi:hypothetical protein
VLFAVLLALGVTEKHDAAHDTRGRHPENGLGLHYSRFSPISADRLLFPQLLAGSKIGNPAANRPSQAKALPEWPPFLIVIDVGHSIETYADFTGTGKHYAQFPDTNSFRILLPELTREEVRDRLRGIWLDPLSLDPSRHAAKVTREIAARLALLGRSLEADGHNAERVALFLMRSLFTMFAEDIGLLPKDSFRELLRGLRGKPQALAPMMRSLWANMNKGGFSPQAGRGHPALQWRPVRKY